MSSYNEPNNENLIPAKNQGLSQSFSYPTGRGFDSGSRKNLQPLGTSSGQKKAKSFLKQGLNKLSQSNYAAALKDFKQALRIDPNFVDAYICQSLVYYYQADYPQAIASCNQVLQINPKNVDAYNNRGLNRCALGEYQDAIADFNQVIEIDPYHAKAFLNRGYSRLQLDDNWSAIEDFDQALRLDPTTARDYLKQIADTLNHNLEGIDNANEQLIKGLLIQGNLRSEAGEYEEAIAVYTQVLSLDPTNTEAHNRRSTARAAVGQHEAALADLYQAADSYLSTEQLPTILPTIEQLPNIEPAINSQLNQQQQPITNQLTLEEIDQQGVEKLAQGDFLGAIEAFNQVLELNANYAKALVCRGFAHRQLGYELLGIKDLEQAAILFWQQGDLKSSQHIVETLKKLKG
ncbi:MAG: tetratricopeptide repeat protein [Coleofasciculaceae cyanobacterium]